jgi:predicted transcriptional regulator
LASISHERRTRLDVIASILDACHYGTKKTHLMYLCNLSFKQLTEYLGLLLEANLLSIQDDSQSLFRVSSKGKDFLKAYDGIKTMME